MKEKDIHQLKKESDELYPKDNLKFIKFFENNLTSIDAIDMEKDHAHYDAKLYFMGEYGLSLNGAGQHTKAVLVLGKVIPLFENGPSIEPNKLNEITYYEHLLWNYGTALWDTKQVKQSTEVLEKLVANYPENDKYRAWLGGLKETNLIKYKNLIWIAAAIWLICEYTVFERLESSTQFSLAIFGAILVFSGLAFEVYIYTMKKRTSARKT